jgi:hypothetical protein
VRSAICEWLRSAAAEGLVTRSGLNLRNTLLHHGSTEFFHGLLANEDAMMLLAEFALRADLQLVDRDGERYFPRFLDSIVDEDRKEKLAELHAALPPSPAAGMQHLPLTPDDISTCQAMVHEMLESPCCASDAVGEQVRLSWGGSGLLWVTACYLLNFSIGLLAALFQKRTTVVFAAT